MAVTIILPCKENPVKEFRNPENVHAPVGQYMHQAALAAPEFKVKPGQAVPDRS
jgi:hypothetical protein